MDRTERRRMLQRASVRADFDELRANGVSDSELRRNFQRWRGGRKGSKVRTGGVRGAGLERNARVLEQESGE